MVPPIPPGGGECGGLGGAHRGSTHYATRRRPFRNQEAPITQRGTHCSALSHTPPCSPERARSLRGAQGLSGALKRSL
eukprot:15439926-Alexandrium_andersonii.AAC.1